jgi:hypothetical protein
MHKIILVIILTLWLGSSLMLLGELMKTQVRLSKVETTAGLLMAAYQNERVAREEREEKARANINP